MNQHKLTETTKNKTGKKRLYLLAAITICNQAYAQLTIQKHTINNGGAVMSGDGFELVGSIGQVDASPTLDEGHAAGNFTLNSGFWQQNTDLIFKDNLE